MCFQLFASRREGPKTARLLATLPCRALPCTAPPSHAKHLHAVPNNAEPRPVKRDGVDQGVLFVKPPPTPRPAPWAPEMAVPPPPRIPAEAALLPATPCA